MKHNTQVALPSDTQKQYVYNEKHSYNLYNQIVRKVNSKRRKKHIIYILAR